MTTLLDISTRFDIPVRFLVATRYVESNGNPAALRFEPHLFQRKRDDLVRQIPRDTDPVTAARMRVSIRAQGLVPYTPGRDHKGNPRKASSSREETDREAFEHAMALDPLVAWESTSFGMFQVLGSFLGLVPSQVEQTLASFDKDPTSTSYRLLSAWLSKNPLAVKAAQRGDIEGFVSRYNGCQGSGCDGYCEKFREGLQKFDHGLLAA